jgi:glucan 1,3-beta-glucosidase
MLIEFTFFPLAAFATKVRGVNLGGWLVLEPFITPSVFEYYDVKDEMVSFSLIYFRISERLSVMERRARKNYKNIGILFTAKKNLKRLQAGGSIWSEFLLVIGPVFYLLIIVETNPTPFIQTPLKYLDNAVRWSRKYGLKVLIDLHGLPGSQNGFDNSGQKYSYLLPQWNPIAIDSTKYVKLLAERFKNDTDTVTSLSPVNEPFLVKLARYIH